jgi:hypothetical protein
MLQTAQHGTQADQPNRGHFHRPIAANVGSIYQHLRLAGLAPALGGEHQSLSQQDRHTMIAFYRVAHILDSRTASLFFSYHALDHSASMECL